jgi:hypothetical protein
MEVWGRGVELSCRNTSMAAISCAESLQPTPHPGSSVPADIPGGRREIQVRGQR